MGSVTTSPPPVSSDIAILQAQFSSLAHKHLTVSYTLVGIIVLILALAGGGGYLALRAFDAQLARAEAREASYDVDRKAFVDHLAADAADRTRNQAAQVVLARNISNRDTKADQAIQVAVKPDASLESTASALTDAYSDVVGFGHVDVLPDSTTLHGAGIELAGHQAQQIVAYKIDRDRLSADLGDLRTSYTLEQASNTSLSNDLVQCKDLSVKAEAVIAGYKKIAKRGKFRVFLGGAEKVLLVAGGMYLGHKF